MGRFAPSPSGDLHLGSLYTATASYLDARAHRGRWLVRLEDLDHPRVVPGSAEGILRTLQSFGFEWDGDILYQSERTAAYVAALERLQAAGLTFPCTCSRSDLADEERYPGHCRPRHRETPAVSTSNADLAASGRPATGAPAAGAHATGTHAAGTHAAGTHAAGTPAVAIRLRVEPGYVAFTDRVQGMFRQDVATTVGDVVLKRRDGIIAYLLAVVVDDAAQGVTHVVRGADLLDNTPRQIHLQRHLQLATPEYAHVPVLTEAGGQKLAKSARSISVNTRPILGQLLDIFRLLGLSPAAELFDATLPQAWAWAITEWRIQRIPRRLSRQLTP